MRTVMAGALCAIAMVASAHAAVREEPVTYMDGEATMKGFVVYDDATQAKRPGIVMVPEWWGITPHMHNEARKFAEQGYTAFMMPISRLRSRTLISIVLAIPSAETSNATPATHVIPPKIRT